MLIKPYRHLNVWKEAHRLVLEIYKESGVFPAYERFGLTNQLRRAAASVSANIVECTGRRTTNDISHFLIIARGSCLEAGYFIFLAGELGYLDQNRANLLLSRYEGLAKGIDAFILNCTRSPMVVTKK